MTASRRRRGGRILGAGSHRGGLPDASHGNDGEPPRPGSGRDAGSGDEPDGGREDPRDVPGGPGHDQHGDEGQGAFPDVDGPEAPEGAARRSRDAAAPEESAAPPGAEVPGREAGEGDEEVPAGLRRFYGGDWKQTARYLDAAYGLLGTLLGLGLIGWLIDRALGKRHTWLLVGLLVGGLVGFYRLGRAMLGRR